MHDSSQSPPPLRAWKDKRRQDELAILDSLTAISETPFVLTWQLEPLSTSPHGENEAQRFWIIKHGGWVIYREPATFEGYNRFEILARLLKEKYGAAIRDLIPSEDSDTTNYLYGNFFGAYDRVQAVRKRTFHFPL